MSETREVKEKRLRMRSMRRGIKEMDLILQAYADAHLTGLSDAGLETYDALLRENDHDIYAWVTGQTQTPEDYTAQMAVIRDMAAGLTKPA